MSEIKVWAPYAKCVELYCEDASLPMHRQENGWWWAEDDRLYSGVDYGFVVDGNGPLPDPRSRWQPKGVHNLSRFYSEDFSWSDADWSPVDFSKAIIYELHVGTFTREGTFDAIEAKLDYLAELGITHIELLPIADFPGEVGWGYDGVSLFAPKQKYGGPRKLKQLIDRCHQKGIAVILDVVYNHLGPSGNYLGHFGAYFSDHISTPWGTAVNMDQRDSPEVRQYFIDNALMWLDEYHFDGLRLDAAHAIADGSAIHFWEQLTAEVRKLEAAVGYPKILIAESHLNDARWMYSLESGGYGLDSQWHDDFHHSVVSYMTEERAGYLQDYGQLAHIAEVFSSGVYFNGQYCKYRGCLLGRPPEGLSGQHFISYIQNHDQVGNRPGGERLSHLLTKGQCKIAAALMLFAPFVPMLFQGEEWLASTEFQYFTDHQEPRLGKAIKQGRWNEAKDFGWNLKNFRDPQSSLAFTQSVLDWDEADQGDHAEMLSWYKSLIQLRLAEPALSAGDWCAQSVRFDEKLKWLSVNRGDYFLVCNFADEQKITLQDKGIACESLQRVIFSEPGVELEPGHLVMAGHSAAIFKFNS